MTEVVVYRPSPAFNRSICEAITIALEGQRTFMASLQEGIAMIRIKRVYEPASRTDGKRILIDRLWPRGLKKEEANIDEWLKDVAPSSDLRKWFGHDPGKWPEFKKRFYAELRLKKQPVDVLIEMTRQGDVTLLFGSKEEQFNNATALKEYIERKVTAKKKAA